MTRLQRLLAAWVVALASLGAAAPASAAATVEVEIVGATVVGERVTAVVSSDEPDRVTYQWTRAYNHSGTALDFTGATRPSFTPTAYFRGKVLGVRVTHTTPEGVTTTVVRSVGLVRPGTLGPARVTVRGATKPGSVLRAAVTPPPTTPPGYSVSLKWYAGNRPVLVDGRVATHRRLRLVPALVERYAGRRLHVRVTTAAVGYLPGTARSQPTKAL